MDRWTQLIQSYVHVHVHVYVCVCDSLNKRIHVHVIVILKRLYIDLLYTNASLGQNLRLHSKVEHSTVYNAASFTESSRIPL